jgi:hypothetical protein
MACSQPLFGNLPQRAAKRASAAEQRPRGID